MTMRIGTAGWTVPKAVADRFASDGSHLQRYARRLNAVEINSSFYKPHRPTTYRRWAEATPADFRFSVKAPKAITHERRLTDPDGPLAAFLDQVACLGERLGPILVQLPPSLGFDPRVADVFFDSLRRRFSGQVACEPRHATWFAEDAEALLSAHRVARVAADPPLVAAADTPGGWRALAYLRLHGSPRVYYSQYGPERLGALTARLDYAARETWVIFDNTTLGAAAEDALALADLLDPRRS